MKKVLALVLALAMLCTFAFIATAATPEEELQAQGRALAEETISIMNSRQFTLRASQFAFDGRVSSAVVAVDGTTIAIETPSVGGFWSRLFLGNRMRVIITPNRLTSVWPGRRLALSIPNEAFPFNDFPVFSVTPEFETEMVTIAGNNYLQITFWHGSIGFRYYYRDGQLRRIVERRGSTETVTLVDSFVGTADQNLFNTRWMIRISLG